MGLALYRKYRPKSLKDVVGQDHIVSALQKAIHTGAISHAYLLTGPKGVGKTSIARILAHELNGLPYSDDSTHLDIIEIDAASNRRIDEIREIRDKVHVAPTSAKYKVYIIDEVHMLTREAFNALLKTLEEPPAHAIFILATTEAHKIPDTILSRTQRYTFKPITATDTANHLRKLAKLEHISIDDEALSLLAEHAGGSFRDSINLLDQLGGHKQTITASSIQQTLGLPNAATVALLLSSIKDLDIVKLLNSVDAARTDGTQAQLLARQLIQEIRQLIIKQSLLPSQRVMLLLDDLLRVTASSQPYSQLELALAKYIAHNDDSAPISDVAATSVGAKTIHAVTAPTKEAANLQNDKDKPQHESVSSTTQESDSSIKISNDTESYWAKLLEVTKAKHNTLYSMLRMAEPLLEDTKLTLTFGFAFHQKQIAQAANIKHIADAMTDIIGKPVQVICLVGSKKAQASALTVTAAASIVQKSKPFSDVSNIFDGAELLE